MPPIKRRSLEEDPPNHPRLTDLELSLSQRTQASCDRIELGALGEHIALRYFESESYLLEAKNWRGRSGELDLILYHQHTLVVVEVRTTSTTWLERPAEATPLSKRRQVARCTNEYLLSRPPQASPILDIRFDICGVLIPRSSFTEVQQILKREPHQTTQTPTPDQDLGQLFAVPRGVSLDHVENAYYSPWAF